MGNNLGIELSYNVNTDAIILKTLYLVDYDINEIPVYGDTITQLETFISPSLQDL